MLKSCADVVQWPVTVACLTVCWLAASQVSADNRVTSAPHIFEQPAEPETAYRPGEEVKLVCVANSESQSTYEWRKNGAVLDIQGSGGRIVMHQNVGSITISKANSDDDGVYQCFARNFLGTAVTMKTTLRPAVLQPFRSEPDKPIVISSVEVGKPHTLRCNPPFGFPRGSIYWGINRPAPTSKLEAIATNDRVVLDYEGHLRITNVVSDDFREGAPYVCVVNNPILRLYVQGNDQKVRPADSTGGPQLTSPSVMWTSPRRDVALKGRSKKLKCIFAGFPTPQVTWRRTDTGKQDRSSTTVDGHGTEIEIANVDFDDGGTYECTGSNGQGSPVSVTITLVVQSVPYWRQNKPPVDKQVDEDDSVDFECFADGNPRPNITWSINGIPVDELPADRRPIVEANRIRYSSVTVSDNAVLQCIASNEHGQILSNAVLTVTAAPPSFTTTPTDTKIVMGKNVTFSCRVYGAPKPRLTWRKGFSRSLVTGSGYVAHSSGDLEIKSAVTADSGTYYCEAVNKFGTDYASAELIVREPTRIANPPLSQKVNANDDVTIDCDAVTDPAENLTVKWRRDGTPIEELKLSHLSVDSRTHRLTIKASKVSDTANYTCHATNGLDSADSPPATVTVRGRPDAPRDVKVTCLQSTSNVTWISGSENNDLILEYIVYVREGPPSSSTAKTADFEVASRISAKPGTDVGNIRVSALIAVKPWRSYEFRVTAVNSLGESDPSSMESSSHRCITPPTTPFRNPSGVCTKLEAMGTLVVVWEPMSEDELNGKDFYYLVKYKLKDAPGEPKSSLVSDYKESEIKIHNLQTFSQFEVTVQAANAEGISTAPVMPIVGYSGEGTPLDVPKNLQLIPWSLNSTHATFSWDAVDQSPQRILGFFRGYRITMWRSKDPNNRRFEDIILSNPPVSCPHIATRQRRLAALLSNSRQQRALGQSKVTGFTNQLWPYSKIKATVAVLNIARSGHESDPIEFETPEGVAGTVATVQITERGSNHLVVEWTPPVEPNGIIGKYYVSWRVAPPNVGVQLEKKIDNPATLNWTIHELESLTVYRIEVAAETTVKGRGSGVPVDGKTLAAANPDKPLIGSIQPGDDSALVTFGPSSELPATNPGTKFYVEYIEQDKTDQSPWNKTKPVVGRGGSVNVTGLEPGKNYTFRVVGVNGIGEISRETRSDPHTVAIGPNNDGLVTFAPPVNVTASLPIADPIKEDSGLRRGSSEWFIILIIIIILLLIILIIACIVKRSRGEMYPVQEKEKLRGRDPLAPDDAPFGEYVASSRPDYDRSRGSLDSDEKPLDSETDSLGEYEDPEATKFNEDGSFIGLYNGQKNRQPPTNSGTTPSAINTFV